MHTRIKQSAFQNVTTSGMSRRSLVTGTSAMAAAAALGLGSFPARQAFAQEASLKFTFWGSTFEKDAVDAMIDQFEGEHDDIEIDAQHIPDEYQTKMNTMIAAGEQPDVAYLDAGPAFDLALEGKLINFQDYVDTYPRLGERLPNTYLYYEPGKWLGTNTAAEIICLFYNRDLISESGVEAPPASADTAWDWDAFIDTALKLTIDDDGKNAGEDGFDADNIRQFGVSFATAPHVWWSLLRSNGGDLADEAGTGYALNSEASVKVVQALQDLIHTHHVAPTPAQRTNFATTAVQLQTRQVAMAIEGQWALLDMKPSGVNAGIGVLPKFQEPLTNILGAPTVIFSDTEYPEAAIEFYLYHNDPDKVDLYAKGLWMPLEERFYTEPDAIASWIDNDVHPEEYKTAVVDYTMNNSVREPAKEFQNWTEIDTALGAGLDPIWLGEQSAQEVLDALQGEIEGLLAGRWPSE